MSVKMIVRQYSPDDGFTADEIKRNVHSIYQDLECPKCKLTIHRGQGNIDETCPRCDELKGE